MVFAIIPAAGIGSRMQSTIPKQYLPLLDGNVLLYSIRALLALPEISVLMVALHPQDRWWPQTEALLSAQERSRVRTCQGGAERWQSVQAALTAVAALAAETTETESSEQRTDVINKAKNWVLVHDAVRPCVRTADLYSLLRRCLYAAEQPETCNDGALLAAPVADTLKRADASLRVLNTVDRDQLWAACTPQLFKLEQLQQALTRAAAAGIAITDEASAIEFCGGRPMLVPCAKDNIKITYPQDLELAALILQAACGSVDFKRSQV